MKQGFVKVAAASCAVVVADVRENTRVILETIHKMEGEGAKVMVLPELALTGYTCSDLFWQSQMIDAAKAVQCSRCALSRRASRCCAEKVSAEL